MGRKSGLAGLLLAAGVAVHAAAAEPGAAYGTFEGRGYVVVWPAGPPSRLVLYFHATAPEPLAYEAQSGMLEALVADAGARGYALLAPMSDVGGCQAPGATPDLSCWRVDALDDELGRIDRLVTLLEETNALSFPVRDAMGYEVGAELVLSGFASGLLDDYGRLGLLDPKPLATGLPPASPDGLLIYLEAAERDPVGAENATALQRALGEAGYGTRTCVRGGGGGRDYDGRRLASFLAWFAVDCRDLAPVLRPSGSGGPPAVVIDGSRALEDGERSGRPQG